MNPQLMTKAQSAESKVIKSSSSLVKPCTGFQSRISQSHPAPTTVHVSLSRLRRLRRTSTSSRHSALTLKEARKRYQSSMIVSGRPCSLKVREKHLDCSRTQQPATAEEIESMSSWLCPSSAPQFESMNRSSSTTPLNGARYVAAAA
jgi:hypothetical protein